MDVPAVSSFDAWLARAEAARVGGDLMAGLAAAQQAYDLAQGDSQQRCTAGQLLAHFCYRTGAIQALVDVGVEVLPTLRQAGHTAALLDLLRMVSLGASDVARFDVALASAQEAHQVALKLDDPARLSQATNLLGCFFERIGDPWQAERLLLEALTIARGCAGAQPRLSALNNLCGALVGAFYLLRDGAPAEEGRKVLERALPHAREAMALVAELPDPFFRVFVQGNLGELLLHLGHYAEAHIALTESLALARQLNAEAQCWRIGCSLGEWQLAQGQLEAAWQTLHEVLQASAHADPRTTHLRLRHALWRTARTLGRPTEALEHLEQYLALERARSLNQLRGQSDLFVTRVEAEQVRLEMQRERARAVELEADTRRDQLTRLGNRREVSLRWPELLGSARSGSTPLSVAMIDIDHFKLINDRFGHAVGDAVLVALAKMLRENTRSDDLVARVGGEEFLLVLPEAPIERAFDICERLRQRVVQHGWDLLAPGLSVTLSAGVTCAPPYEVQSLTRHADDALYRAKREGRNRVIRHGSGPEQRA